MGEGPAQISHGGSQGFKSPHLHPKPAGQSVASVERATLTACSGRAAAASSSHSPAGRALRDARGLGPRPHHDHVAWSPPAADRRAILARIPPLSVGHLVDLATAQPPPTTTTKSKPTRLWPSTACASLEGQAPTSGRRRAVVDTAGDHADSGHPSRAAAGPTATPHDLIPVGHNGRRRPDTGHLDAQTPAPDTGHLDRPRGTPDACTGHRTGTRTR
jgi:hypothetical protein